MSSGDEVRGYLRDAARLYEITANENLWLLEQAVQWRDRGANPLRVNVLMTALRAGVAHALLRVPAEDPDEAGAVAAKMMAVLRDEHGLKGGLARWAVEAWAEALGRGSSAATPTLGGPRLSRTDCPELVYVPAGEFIMGSADDDECPFDDERPAHTVYLDAYWIGKTPVTVAQYRAFCGATGIAMPETPEWGWVDTHPIVNVSWNDASAYCQWAELALPTEAQWEKAARGTDGRIYPWGNAWDPARCVCSDGSEGMGSTAPVGSLPADASPYGCLDMAGNVSEWCADWFGEDYYAASPGRNPAGPATGRDRSLRGASWNTPRASLFRAARRNHEVPTVRVGGYLGFRVVSRPDSH